MKTKTKKEIRLLRNELMHLKSFCKQTATHDLYFMLRRNYDKLQIDKNMKVSIKMMRSIFPETSIQSCTERVVDKEKLYNALYDISKEWLNKFNKLLYK